MNKIADALAKPSLSEPVIDVLPALKLLIGVRLRKKLLLKKFPAPSFTATSEFKHLMYHWYSNICQTRRMKVAITRLRC